VKLLLDEQITHRVARALRDRGHDVRAVAEDPSARGLGDREIFDLTQVEQRALVTYNVADFTEIVREVASRGETHFGVVFVNSGRLPNSDVGGLTKALQDLLEAPALEQGAVTWLQPVG